MQIKRLSAVFGRLRSETIQFSDGLNIIEAPNESGKSTWCAFLTAMLYGINSRERDRADYIADKNRYAPWDGTVMAGSMDCRSEGRDITISRDTRRQTAPMAEFRAVYSGTNIAIDGLTGQNCGEALLGVTREVFERSAFIRQSGLAISQDAGLERRVAALISSGEEDTSYTEAYDALKKQLNRRRYNKSGLLPALEAQQAETQAQLNRVQQLRQQETALHAQLQDLIQQQAALSDELEQCDRWEAAQKQRQLSDLTAAAQQAAQRAQAMEDQLQADHVPDTETIGRLRGAIVNLETVRKSVDKARADRDEAMKTLLRAEKAVNDSPFAGQTVEEARKEAAVPPKVSFNAAPALAVFFLMLAAAIGVTAFTLSRYSVYLSGWQKALPWSIFAVIIAAGAVISRQMQKRALKAAQNTALCKRFGTADADEIAALAETYAKAVETRDTAQADLNAKSGTAEALYSSLTNNEQGILLEVRRFAPSAFDIPTADQVLQNAARQRRALTEARTAAAEAQARQSFAAEQTPSEAPQEMVPQPARSRERAAAEYAQVQSRAAAVQSELDRLSGQLHVMGDPSELQAGLERTQDEISTLQSEYDALRLAMDILTAANSTLQNRFSPQLSRRTAELFQELSMGRYTGAALDRSFHLTAQPTGDPLQRDIHLLSAGAADQLYLAARLAICQLVLPEEKQVPIILDDALTNFDDERCAAALRLLKQEAAHRQILLFTCHSREAALLAGDPAVTVFHLGNSRSVASEC